MSNDAEAGQAVFTLEQVVAFLCGEAPLDGVWFGEKHPTERGMFWWRKHLRPALTRAPEVQAGWKLVPVEPTEAMRKAGGFHEWSGGFDRNGSHTEGEYCEYTHSLEHNFGTYGCEGAAAEVWAAMVAASPEPQS